MVLRRRRHRRSAPPRCWPRQLLGSGSGCLHILAYRDSSIASMARHNEWVTDRRLKTLVLGSTGSIGTQALEVIAATPARFERVGLPAGGATPELLLRQRSETGGGNLAVDAEVASAVVGNATN